jgi:hypothetical protein
MKEALGESMIKVLTVSFSMKLFQLEEKLIVIVEVGRKMKL